MNLERIKQAFSPTAFQNDEEKARQARLLVALLATLLILCLVWNFLEPPVDFDLRERLIVDAVGFAFLVPAGVLLGFKRTRPASLLTFLGFYLGVLATAIFDGGVVSPAFSGLTLVIIIGGLLLGEQAILAGAAGTILTGLFLVLVAEGHWFPRLPLAQGMYAAWLTQSIYITVAAVITTLAIQNTQEALRRARKELHERELVEAELRKFRQGIEHSSEAIFMTDREGTILYANPAFEEVYGYSPEEVTGKNPRILQSGLTSKESYQRFWAALLSGQVVRHGVTNRRKDGSIVMLDGSVSPVINDNGEITGYLTIHTDVTERVQAEQALHDSMEKAQAMFNGLSDGIAFTDMQGRITDVNDAVVKMHGYTCKEDLIGKMANLLIAPSDWGEAAQLMIQTLTSGENRLREYHFMRADGSVFVGELKTALLKDKNGQPTGFVSLTRDISQRKAAENALRESENTFRSFVEETSDAVFITDESGIVLEWNRSAERITGLKHEEVVGKPAWDILFTFVLPERRTPERYQSLRGMGQEGLRTGEGNWLNRNTTIQYLRADGSRGYGEQMGFVIKTERGYRLGNVFTDITERKLAEMRIAQQVSQLTALHTIDIAITSGLDMRATMDLLLTQTRVQLNVDAAGILLLNETSGVLEVINMQGFRDDQWEAGAKLDLNTTFAGRAAREQRILTAEIGTHPPEGFPFWYLLQREQFQVFIVAPLITKGEVKGVMELFFRRPFQPNEDWLRFLEALSTQAAIAIDNRLLFQDLQQTNAELSQAYDTTLEGWARALDLRDKETEFHTRRVVELSLGLAGEMNFSESQVVDMRRGAWLHDIGKMGISDKIVRKEGALTPEEWEIMRRHPQIAYDLLKPVKYLSSSVDIPYCHHEKWDGSGYPRGLKGEDIPLAARVFAVADVYDALTSDRVYRSAWPHEKALDYIQEQSGKQFDPQVVEVFFRLIEGDYKPGPSEKIEK